MTADAQIKPGTLVVAAGSFGTVMGESRRGGAKGYDVATVPADAPFGAPVHFVQDYLVHRAELGVNVCTKRRGKCFCGLVHIPHPEWLEAS